jgi:hypothetical protein
MRYREPWDKSNYQFNRQDEWSGATFVEEEDLWDADHLRLYTGRWIMVCLVALGALLWIM